IVDTAEEKKGLLFYRAGTREVAEAELADSISFSKPEERLLVGQIDDLQLFIAGEVASRLLPRVLLADEVGLGKTIEAGLILHRLHLTGRAERVLILV